VNVGMVTGRPVGVGMVAEDSLGIYGIVIFCVRVMSGSSWSCIACGSWLTWGVGGFSEERNVTQWGWL